MNPVYGILLAALLFAVFGAFYRRESESSSCGADPQGCGQADETAGCSACPSNHETTESSHGRF